MTEKGFQKDGQEAEIRVTFQPQSRSCKVPEGRTIMAAAASQAIDLRSDCGGRGKCGKCLVEVSPAAHVSQITEIESQYLSDEALKKGGRLACRAQITGPLSVSVPQAGTDGREALGKSLEADAINDVRPHLKSRSTGENSLGLAIDIGTTTLALYLCDLHSGAILHSAAEANPQRRYGEDVISRIAYSNDHQQGLEILRTTIVEAINNLLGLCLQNSGADRQEIGKVTVVGNTTMQHLFAGLHPGKLGLSPYMPESCSARHYRAADLGLALNKECSVYLFPVVSGFVGGDTVGAMLWEKTYLRDEVSLVIDIGTNGEIVLGNRESTWVASCATGPALEGAHIECGMRASAGAIEKVVVDPINYLVDYTLIGEDTVRTPRGLCGSGIIDAVAEMVQAGLILANGRLCEGLPGIVVDEKGIGREFVIAEGGKSSEKYRIVLTLADIRQVQLAKSALGTGIKLLMKKAGIDKFERLVLTGAFGARFNWRNALVIGMLPEITSQAEVTIVGNAAGRGAVLALLNEELRAEIELAAQNAHLLELAEDPDFGMEFVLQTTFPKR